MKLFLILIIAIAIPGIVFAEAGELGEICRTPNLSNDYAPPCNESLQCQGGICIQPIRLIAPDNTLDPTIDKRTSSFQWCEVSGAKKYVLDIDRFDESIDNLSPDKCKAPKPSDPADCDPLKLCTIEFLRLPQGRRPDFNLPYEWKISAYDATETKIGVSSTWEFKTSQRVVAPPGQESPGDGGKGGTSAVLENPISSKTLPELLENVLNFLFGISIVILPIIIIYGGILLLTAGGDPTKISKARTILLWAVIAFAIILLARGLPPVLRNLL